MYTTTIYLFFLTAGFQVGSSLVSCPSYSATNTNSALENYEQCLVELCPGDTITMGCCFESSSCVGDTYIRLYDYNGVAVQNNDDYCGLLSQLTYEMPSSLGSCQMYSLHEGCFSSNSCSGTIQYDLQTTRSRAPTYSPTQTPTATPTQAPTIHIETCAPFSAIASAKSACNHISVCPGEELTIGCCFDDSVCSGDTLFALNDSHGIEVAVNDDNCGLLSSIKYVNTGNSCENYTLIEGCYGSTACGGIVKYTVTDYVEDQTPISSSSSSASSNNVDAVLIVIIILAIIVGISSCLVLYSYINKETRQLTASGITDDSPIATVAQVSDNDNIYANVDTQGDVVSSQTTIPTSVSVSVPVPVPVPAHISDVEMPPIYESVVAMPYNGEEQLKLPEDY